MNSDRKWWILTTTLLVLGSVVLTAWLSKTSPPNLERFETYTERTKEGRKVLIIRDKATKKPVWTEYLDVDEKPAVLSSYYEGKVVFELHLRSIDHPERAVNLRRGLSYYGEDGNLKLLLVDRRGDGLFSDRVIYGEGEPRMEIWYDSRWMPLEERGGKRGLNLNGNWSHVTFTNGAWTPLPK